MSLKVRDSKNSKIPRRSIFDPVIEAISAILATRRGKEREREERDESADLTESNLNHDDKSGRR